LGGDEVVELLDEVADAMVALTSALETGSGAAEIQDVICAEAVRVVPGADMASITAVRDSGPETLAFTDERAFQVDQAQYRAGAGPCLEAAASGEIVRMSTDTAGERWSEFVASAKQYGVRSYLAAPLRVDEHLSGAINLFGFEDHGFEETDSKLLKVYTTVVAFGFRTVRRYQETYRIAENLQTAMRSRAVIEQAKGMLMVIHEIDDVQAMGRLITKSQETNTKLRDVAAEFVRTMSAGRG
jgi:GAF domain-containing protein